MLFCPVLDRDLDLPASVLLEGRPGTPGWLGPEFGLDCTEPLILLWVEPGLDLLLYGDPLCKGGEPGGETDSLSSSSSSLSVPGIASDEGILTNGCHRTKHIIQLVPTNPLFLKSIILGPMSLNCSALPDDKILDWYKLKQIADDILKCI